MPLAASPSERSILTACIAFGILAVVLGVFGLRDGIRNPVARRVTAATPASPPTADAIRQQQRDAAAALDTDRDGLSDLNELERTRTSPFLADSDSDGRSDAEEIAAGTDPNCPSGTQCVVSEEIPPRAPPVGSDAHAVSGSASTPTPAAIRQALVQQGVPRETLDRLTDEQLMAAYRSTLGSLAAPSGATDAAPSPLAGVLTAAFGSALTPGSDPAAVLAALPRSATEVRKLLAKTAFPKEDLARLDDATLERMWAQVLDAYAVELRAGARTSSPP